MNLELIGVIGTGEIEVIESGVIGVIGTGVIDVIGSGVIGVTESVGGDVVGSDGMIVNILLLLNS